MIASNERPNYDKVRKLRNHIFNNKKIFYLLKSIFEESNDKIDMIGMKLEKDFRIFQFI